MLLCAQACLSIGGVEHSLWRQADYARCDHTLPPQGNHRGIKKGEPRHGTAHAKQNLIFSVLRVGEERLFNSRAAQFRTPFSGRSFLHSPDKALDVDTADRDIIGDWAAQESDRYARRARIANVQKQVSATLWDTLHLDPPSEQEALEVSNSVEKFGVDSAEKDGCTRLLGGRSFTS